MAWTYNSALAADRDKVRFLAQENDAANQLVQDEEIDFLLAQEANVYMAAASVVEMVAARTKNVASKALGTGDSVSYGAQHYLDLAKRLRLRGSLHQIPFAGGISVGEIRKLTDDPDWPRRDFQRGLHDHPETVLPPILKAQEEP